MQPRHNRTGRLHDHTQRERSYKANGGSGTQNKKNRRRNSGLLFSARVFYAILAAAALLLMRRLVLALLFRLQFIDVFLFVRVV